MDRDCLDDIVFLVSNERIAWMQNLGAGRFADPVSEQLGSEFDGASLTDVTGDGRVDLVLVEGDAGLLTIRPGLSVGGFGTTEESLLGTLGFPYFADFDGDGAPDLLSGTGGSGASLIVLAWNDRSLKAAPTATGVSPIRALPPTPNPSRGRTSLNFEGLDVDEFYEIHIVDVQGRLVHRRTGRARESEHLCITWDGEAEGGRWAPEGIYFARLTTSRGAATMRIVRVP
jgi:hypothetical protein